jgi:hypothetical protein
MSGRGTIVDAASNRWGIREGATDVSAEDERAEPRLGSDAASQLA